METEDPRAAHRGPSTSWAPSSTCAASTTWCWAAALYPSACSRTTCASGSRPRRID